MGIPINRRCPAAVFRIFHYRLGKDPSEMGMVTNSPPGSEFAGAEHENRTEAGGGVASRACGAGERYVIIALFCLMLILRIAYAYRFRFDTDEPQHLHVVWGWVSGLLPYRDVFDNHGPLFHVLCAPLLRALGERPDILILMRLAMIPLLAISLLCVFQIGKALSSSRVGLWAAVFTGFYPEFFFTSTEFRTDDLWTVLWLLVVVFATRERITNKYAFLGGLLLGAAFCVTVKSGLLVGALAFGAGAVLAQRWLAQKRFDLSFVASRAALGVAGFALMPLGWLLFFWLHGAAREFLYCNVTHNLVPKAQNWEHMDAHLVWFPIFFLLTLGALAVFRNRVLNAIETRRLFLVLIAGAYFTALKSFFPTLTRQDDLPFIPLACLCATLLIDFLARRMTLRMPRVVKFLFPALAALEALFIVTSVPLSRNDASEQVAMLGDVLRATRPSDYVMDATGEAIYRRRPFYYALEAFTLVRIKRGLIRDEIVDDLIKTRTAVVLPHGMTKSAKSFITENYLAVGNGVSILGKRLIPSIHDRSTEPFVFKVVIPDSYRIVRNGIEDVTGKLDGSVASGPRFLEAGEHTFQNSSGDYSGICLFWSAGFERGFAPLAAQPHSGAE
jgi:hypothetical protein